MISGIASLADFGGEWRLPILGIAAIALSGWLVRKVVKKPLEHATKRIREDLTAKRVPLPRRLVFAPLLLNSLTLGLGGSAGAEEPIAYSGAAIASRIANRLRLSEREQIVFLACGAGAGIAAIFQAPIGGMLFVVEVIGFSMPIAGFAVLLTMCLFAGATAYACGGFAPTIAFTTCEPFALNMYLPAIVLGVACGLYSRYYIFVGQLTERNLMRLKRPMVRNLVAGVALGFMLLFFPTLYGEGYGLLANVLNSRQSLSAALLAGILIIKPLAAFATNSGGGVAGDFAPTIFAGGMLGALFTVCPILTDMPHGDFIVLAMAGAMAGITRAPLMAIFIVLEMCMNISLTFPVSLVSLISFCIAKIAKFSKTKH